MRWANACPARLGARRPWRRSTRALSLRPSLTGRRSRATGVPPSAPCLACLQACRDLHASAHVPRRGRHAPCHTFPPPLPSGARRRHKILQHRNAARVRSRGGQSGRARAGVVPALFQPRVLAGIVAGSGESRRRRSRGPPEHLAPACGSFHINSFHRNLLTHPSTTFN